MTAAAASMPRHEAAALLGVPIDSSAAEVQHAYLRAARRTHPDVVPDTDDAGRRAAGAAFARLTAARDVLVVPLDPAVRAAAARPGAAGPPLRRPAQRGLGGSLVILALLAFLLIGIVSAEQAFQGWGFDPSPAATTAP